MAYDFGNLAAPVKSDKAYDFGSLAKPVTRPSKAPPSTDKKPDAASTSFVSNVFGPEEAILNVASGIVAKPVSDIAGLAAMGKEIVSPSGGDPEGFRKHVQEELTYQPRTAVGKGAAEYNPVSLIGKGVGKVAGATGGAIKGDASNDSARGIIGNAVQEGIQQGAGFIGVKGAPKVAKAAGDIPMGMKLTPEMKALNDKARDMGITLQPHHFSDNKFFKIFGEAMDNVPLSGTKDAKNQVAFEKSLIKQIGGDSNANRLTPKVFDTAMRKSGVTIDAITRKYEVPPTKEFVGKLTNLENEAGKVETPENAKIISGYVEKITSKMSEGPLKGTAFRKLNTELSRKIRSTENGDLKAALSDLQDTLLEEFDKNVTNPSDKKTFLDARTKYAKAKTLAPIVGDPKGVSPQKLLGAIRNTKANKERYARGRAGELGELADIGQLLKDPNSSNTAERGLVYGALGSGVAGIMSPAFAIPAAATYGLANLYNRAGPLMIPDVPKK